MRVLVIVNDQPYGSERPYNALRLPEPANEVVNSTPSPSGVFWKAGISAQTPGLASTRPPACQLRRTRCDHT